MVQEVHTLTAETLRDGYANGDLSRSTPFNFTGQPAASIPVGLAADDLPVGMQIVGPRFSKALILRASRAFEQAMPFAARPNR